MGKTWSKLGRNAIKIGGGAIVVLAIIVLLDPILHIITLLEPSIYVSISIATLTIVGLLLLEYLSEVKRLIVPPKIGLHSDQDEVDERLKRYIEFNKPSEADLLQVSLNWAFYPIVLPLANEKSNIRLLMLNPKKAKEIFSPSLRQNERICSSIRLRLNEEANIKNYDKIRVRFYNQFPSIRGMKLGDRMLNLGWYTYDPRKESTDPIQIWGHNNASLIITAEDKDFASAKGLFDKGFNNLWKEADLPINVCGKCEEKMNGRCRVTDDWLKLVSRD